MSGVGLTASESNQLPFPFFRVVLISDWQWSSRYGHGLCGIGTGVCPLFFQFFSSLLRVRASSLRSYILTLLNVGSQLRSLDLPADWLLDSDPPYPGYKGCFVTFAHKYDLLFISVLTNIWDSCKCKYTIWCFSWLKLLSDVDTHVGSCRPSLWAILVLMTDSSSKYFFISVRASGNSALVNTVYRDGKALKFGRLRICWCWP